MFNYLILIYLLIVIQGILIIVSKNPVISVLLLIGIFLLSSLCFIMVGAEFLGILLIIVYVGAVSILFLFVVMMLNLRIVEVHNTLVNYVPIGSFIGFFFFFEFLYMIYNDLGFNLVYLYEAGEYNSMWLSKMNIYSSNIKLIAEVLYNDYSFLLIFAGLILLLAMLGAIVLTVDFNYRGVARKVQLYGDTRMLTSRINFWKIKN